MYKYHFHIIENVHSSDNHQNLPYPYSILKIPEDIPIIANVEFFTSLADLKRYSKVFHEFKKTNPKGAAKICENRFIKNIRDFILTPDDECFNKYAWNLLRHTIHGKEGKNFTGIHLISQFNNQIQCIRETKPPDKNGVWEAEITVTSSTKSKEFIKTSTLFPKHWTETTFMFEIYEAIKKMTKKENSNNLFVGTTKSGVPVEFVIKNDIALSTYPIYFDE